MVDGIKRPEDLYSLNIPNFKETLKIRWKEEMMETPVFRRQQGDQICPTTPLVYSDLNQYLKRLGVLAGYPQKLTTYVLRRGAANAVDCRTPSPLLPGAKVEDESLTNRRDHRP
jgi:hypothetical protein